MTPAHTTRTIASLGIVLAALVAPAATAPAQTIADPAPKPAPVVVEVAAEPAPVEPVIFAIDVDETAYTNTIATFEANGFEAPDFLARFHTTDEACKGHRGLHVVTSDGVSTIHVCATHDNPLVIEIVRERTLMHEVAHAWVNQNVSAQQMADFMELRGLTVWDDGSLAAWENLGAEHAAEILLWGMTDETRNINPRIDDSDIDNLRAAYRVLISGTSVGHSQSIRGPERSGIAVDEASSNPHQKCTSYSPATATASNPAAPSTSKAKAT